MGNLYIGNLQNGESSKEGIFKTAWNLLKRECLKLGMFKTWNPLNEESRHLRIHPYYSFTRNTTAFGSKSLVSHWFIKTTNSKPELPILTASMCIKTAKCSFATECQQSLLTFLRETTEEIRLRIETRVLFKNEPKTIKKQIAA